MEISTGLGAGWQYKNVEITLVCRKVRKKFNQTQIHNVLSANLAVNIRFLEVSNALRFSDRRLCECGWCIFNISSHPSVDALRLH